MIAEYLMNWSPEAIVCLLVGLLMVIIEFIMPGFMGFGIAGAVFLIAAVAIHADSAMDAVISCVLITLILSFSAFTIFRSLKRGRLSRLPLILHERIETGPLLSGKEMQDMTGREGISLNLLRPSGNADFDGVRLDVITSGEMIDKGKRIRIERVEGNRIMVKEIKHKQ